MLLTNVSDRSFQLRFRWKKRDEVASYKFSSPEAPLPQQKEAINYLSDLIIPGLVRRNRVTSFPHLDSKSSVWTRASEANDESNAREMCCDGIKLLGRIGILIANCRKIVKVNSRKKLRKSYLKKGFQNLSCQNADFSADGSILLQASHIHQKWM